MIDSSIKQIMAFNWRINNFKAIAICSIGSGVLGFFMMASAGIMLGVSLIEEIEPPDYDENFKRFMGAHTIRLICE